VKATGAADVQRERAMAARLKAIAERSTEELRKVAPDVKVGKVYESPLERLARLYCPEAYEKDAKWQAAWVLFADLDQKAREGYHVVMHPDNGGFIRLNELVLAKRPTDLVQADMDRRRYIDKGRLQEGTEEDAAWKRTAASIGGTTEQTRPRSAVTEGALQDGV
jgi:hypothetical protein